MRKSEKNQWSGALGMVAMAVVIAVAGSTPQVMAQAQAEQELIGLFEQDEVFVSIPEGLYDRLGWDLPDNGQSVKTVANAAPGGAFDPRKLETIPSSKLGYTAKWHEHRFPYYGLDWDIGGLELTPNDPEPGLPTLVIIHGGSANWYEFYVELFNNPGLGQYLAQKVPVLLLTIPGNYKHGGWTEPSSVDRVPAYLLDREISREEGKVRNSVFTFSLIVEGVRQIIEKVTTGPVVVVGHSTGGEIPFLLAGTSLGARMNGLFLGWGSGGPARLDETLSGPEQHRESARERFSQYGPVKTLRARTPGEYAYNSAYIGPLNPCKGDNLEVAECWFRQEARRRPAFKQKLQDLEHSGASMLLEATAVEMREGVKAGPAGEQVDVAAAIRDLFSTNRAGLTGYRKMLWLVAKLDSHARMRDGIPSEARMANEFRKENPGAAIRVGLFDVPMTHFGHVERPKGVAAGLVAGLKWLVE